MTVNSIPLKTAIPISTIMDAGRGSGSVVLPVSTNSFSYSNFKHIKEIPSQNSSGGYSVSKLRIIDNLIDRMIKLKGESFPVDDGAGLSSENMDILIEMYSQELHAEIGKADISAVDQQNGIAVSVNYFA